jgi:hypothetical protein
VARATAVQLHVPIYKSIIDVGKRLNDFIKAEKRASGLFDVALFKASEYPIAYTDGRCAEAMQLLEEYVQSFDREPSPEMRKFMQDLSMIRIEVRKERLLQAVHALYDNGICDGCQWREMFRRTVDYLDKQLLEVRKSRRELLKWDLLRKPGVTLDHEMTLCELMDWKVNEPEIGCKPFEDLMDVEE